MLLLVVLLLVILASLLYVKKLPQQYGNKATRSQHGGYPNSIASSPEFAFPAKQIRNWTQTESRLRGKQQFFEQSYGMTTV